MKSFKDLIETKSHFETSHYHPSVNLTSDGQSLLLTFNSRDVITDASYRGKIDPWLSSLCEILKGKDLVTALDFNLEKWSMLYPDDALFWDMKAESDSSFFFFPLELLRGALDVYRGRDYLYTDLSPLICRCFGVRESDVLTYLKTAETPTLDGLGVDSKAGMGCRSCVKDLKRWMESAPSKEQHRYKDRSKAQWLMEIDQVLAGFPEAKKWKMEVLSFKNQQVVIGFDFECSQVEEENVSKELQGFLAGFLDSDLAFFLIRTKQRSNADG